MVGPNAAPVVLYAVDSIALEWDTPPPPKDFDQMTDDDRREYAQIADTPQPTLLVSGPFGRLRVFPPPAVVRALGQAGTAEAIMLALASHQIDRLPWPAADATEQGRLIRPPVLRP